MGCPIKASMEVVEIGETEVETPVYLDKHASVNRTARVLVENGVDFIAAWNLHGR